MLTARSIIHKLSYSFTLSLLLVLVALLSWFLDTLFGWLSWNMSFPMLVEMVGFLLLLLLIITLPLDYFSYRKDKIVCTSEGLDYKVFIRMEALEKQSIYEKYASE